MKTNSLAAWILAVRPYSLVNAVILVGVGSALACSEGGFRALPALLCLLFAVLMQCTANLVNDLCDFRKGADRPDRLGPDRAVAKGYITQRALRIGIAGFTAAAILAGVGLLLDARQHLVLPWGGWELAAVGAACVLFAYLYTAGPCPLAYLGLGDAAVILFFGVVPVTLTCFLQTGRWSTASLIASAACGLAIDTMLMINNFRDRDEDARCRKRTLVVRFGARFGSWGYCLLGAGAVGWTLALLGCGYRFGALLPLGYLPLHLATWRKMVRIDRGAALNRCLGETARNITLFGLLLTAGLLLDRLIRC